jgi:glycosyltransferase involved in cell wall biosynthesis
MPDKPLVVYVAAAFPKLSETFVYREFLGLRKAGWRVRAVGLNASPNLTGEPAIDALANETVVLYDTGKAAVLGKLFRAASRHPVGTSCAISLGVFDAVFGERQSWRRRLKGIWHAAVGAVLAAELAADRPRHLHAHMAHAPTSVTMYAAVALGVSFSFTGHAADLFRDRLLLRPKLRRARFVVAISHWHRAFYQSLVERPTRDFPVIRCPVDTEEFAVVPRAAGGPVRLLSVCRLVAKKGIDQLLNALALLKERQVDFRCEIIGDGPEEKSLHEQAYSLGLEHVVEFRGAQPNSVVREAMSHADVFVLPCRIDENGDRDGIPVALMEAMASGVAVVSGSLPAIHELITPGESGLLVSPDSPNELAGAMRWLIEDRQTRQGLAGKGRNRVIREFSLQANTERLTAMLKEAI